MMRGRIIGAVLAGLVLAAPACAEGFADSVVRQLQMQGFTEFRINQTLLGRTRILASGEVGSREIVLNPATGEILRDLWLRRGGEDRWSGGSGNGGDTNGGNSGSGGSSGSGGDTSGGNSGSGGGSDDDDDD